MAEARGRTRRFAPPHHRADRRAGRQGARAGRPSRIFAKLNALVDYRVIESLLSSQSGAPIELLVRGVCCLRPGMPGISENIRVRSIVDRFLEHSRLYVFSPDDEAQIYLASADWMPRNFYRRVEVMFPIEAPNARARILEEIIPAYLRDNVKTRILRADGSHYRIERQPDEPRHRCQEELLHGRVGAIPAAADILVPPNGENGAAKPSDEAARN